MMSEQPSMSSTVEREEVVLEECMLLSFEELDNLSGWICRELCDHDVLSDFVLATFLQVTTMTMATIVRRKPAIDAEMMMSRGMDSEIENDSKKRVCYFL